MTDAEELEEYRKLFDLRHEADRRAVKRWQAMNPDRANVWPDHADLVVWLLKRVERAEAIAWAITKAAGGSVKVGLGTLAEFKEGKSVLAMIQEPGATHLSFETLEVRDAAASGR